MADNPAPERPKRRKKAYDPQKERERSKRHIVYVWTPPRVKSNVNIRETVRGGEVFYSIAQRQIPRKNVKGSKKIPPVNDREISKQLFKAIKLNKDDQAFIKSPTGEFKYVPLKSRLYSRKDTD